MNRNQTIFTIGHSNLSLDRFIQNLKQHQITAIADVRSHPYSHYRPHFNRAFLQVTLKKAKIQYVFLGKELGARPTQLSCYAGGKALYDRISQTELFQGGIERLLEGSKKYNISLMCAEKDPITCHRTILICQSLKNYDLNIQHILESGNLESHNELEERLLYLQNLHPAELAKRPQQLSLFASLETPVATLPRTRDSFLQQAYRQQGEKIAYVDKPRSKK